MFEGLQGRLGFQGNVD
ncbi:uncharacterized protein FTOL_13446 [Fusarium torulosum]|uniref:Uncharacterized protein n=1 Tax=Fusarium torulosum TaxID=33205 RepID=A0AAE8MNL5_9HYPO|nr:uncharacterized protein FTOL_13446 [Fusarium torulosum]